MQTFNCAGLGLATRRKAVFEYLRTLDVQIFCLQETHSTTLDEHKWAVEWGKTRALFHSNQKNDRNNGVAFLLNHPGLNLTNWHGDQHGRVSTADFSTCTEKLHITNIYAPHSGHPTRERAHFFDSLYVYVHSSHTTILAGDFNCVENSRVDREPPTMRNDPIHPLRELHETFDLEDTLRRAHGNARLFTRRQGNVQSRLDRFYASKTIEPLAEYTFPGLSSDHNIVILGINNITITTHGTGRWKNNVTIYPSPLPTQMAPMVHTTTFFIPNQDRMVDPNQNQNLLKQHAKIKQSTEKRTSEIEALCRDVNNNPALLPIYTKKKQHRLSTKLPSDLPSEHRSEDLHKTVSEPYQTPSPQNYTRTSTCPPRQPNLSCIDDAARHASNVQ